MQREAKLTLTQAAKRSPGRPHASTVWRWCRAGLNGVRLEYVRFGRRIFTSAEALERFVEALAKTDERSADSDGKQAGGPTQ